ncbi:hypothetical protein ACH5RR_026220 [Cinchona calisaya]|uniref:Reverse transcriptase zinc-binding domain-containing protein n=1 Tax=Cinchona calisaya TaxID=153742 RepID=A0ABD2Z322_9GENT
MEVEAISSIPLSKSLIRDRWVWHHNKNGQFSVHSAYHLAIKLPEFLSRGVSEGLGSDGVNGVWNVIWHMVIPPKIKHFMWQACNNVLPMMVQLGSRGVNLDQHCLVCRGERENLSRILFHCRIAKEIWHHSNLKGAVFGVVQELGGL